MFNFYFTNDTYCTITQTKVGKIVLQNPIFFLQMYNQFIGSQNELLQTNRFKGTRCLGSDELVFEKRCLSPFVIKCIYIWRVRLRTQLSTRVGPGY